MYYIIRRHDSTIKHLCKAQKNVIPITVSNPKIFMAIFGQDCSSQILLLYNLDKTLPTLIFSS